MDKAKLLKDGLIKFIIGLVLVALIIFIPAGTLDYPKGWLFMALLFVPIIIMGIVLYLYSPSLLAKRLQNKEKEKAQQGFVKLSGLIIMTAFIISGLDYRFGWSNVPMVITVIGAVLMEVGYLIFAIVMKQNEYLSRIVEVQQGQKVVDTGLYSIVRHPMYMGAIIMFVPMPLVLGSYFGFLVFLVYPLCFVQRIKNEEMVLEKGLKGYSEYKKKVKYRLIPKIW